MIGVRGFRVILMDDTIFRLSLFLLEDMGLSTKHRDPISLRTLVITGFYEQMKIDWDVPWLLKIKRSLCGFVYHFFFQLEQWQLAQTAVRALQIKKSVVAGGKYSDGWMSGVHVAVSSGGIQTLVPGDGDRWISRNYADIFIQFGCGEGSVPELCHFILFESSFLFF